MSLYAVAEKFVSINGEGRKAGELAVFIRFRKCNLRCSYCDTKWANTDHAQAEMMTEQEIADYIKASGVKNVTLTGGEPLLRENMEELISLLGESGFAVEIETNGSIPLKNYGEMTAVQALLWTISCLPAEWNRLCALKILKSSVTRIP